MSFPNLKQSFFKNGQIVNLAKKLLKSDKILKDCFDLALCMNVFWQDFSLHLRELAFDLSTSTLVILKYSTDFSQALDCLRLSLQITIFN